MRKSWILLAALSLSLTGCGGGCSKSKEEQEVKQATQVPILVCEKDGVRVHKVYDSTDGGSSYVYFTVPIGSTYWNTTDGEGNVEHHRVVGPQTAAPKKK